MTVAFSRYNRTPQLGFGAQYGTTNAIAVIRKSVKDGSLSVSRQFTLRGADRLDTLAGSLYGDGRYWWILAAASDIGWGLQVPPGTVINAPELKDVKRLVG